MSRRQAYEIILKHLGVKKGLIYLLFNRLKVEKKILAKFQNHHLFIRSTTNDLYIANSVLCGDEYEHINVELIARSDSKLIIDVGAHIGSSALKLRQLFPSHKILCIEAERRNFEILRRNLREIPNIEIMHRALSNEAMRNQFISLRKRYGRSGFTIIEEPNDFTNAKIVERSKSISLCELLSEQIEQEISFLKVDVEGAEILIFDGRNDISEKINVAYIETHDRIVPGCTEIVREFFRNSHFEIEMPGEKLFFVRK